MPKYISVNEASKLRKCSPANIRYLIRTGKLDGKKENGQWVVSVEALNERKDFSHFDDIVLVLQEQLKEKDKQIETKDKQINLLQETINQQNQLLALEKQEKLKLLEAKKSWWQKITRR